MGKELINGEIRATIRASLLMIKGMDLGKCIGRKMHFIGGSGSRELSQGKVKCGRMIEW